MEKELIFKINSLLRFLKGNMKITGTISKDKNEKRPSIRVASYELSTLKKN